MVIYSNNMILSILITYIYINYSINQYEIIYIGDSIIAFFLCFHWLELGDPGTYTGDVVWLGMHDRRGGEYDADRQMIKVYIYICIYICIRNFLLCY